MGPPDHQRPPSIPRRSSSTAHPFSAGAWLARRYFPYFLTFLLLPFSLSFFLFCSDTFNRVSVSLFIRCLLRAFEVEDVGSAERSGFDLLASGRDDGFWVRHYFRLVLVGANFYNLR